MRRGVVPAVVVCAVVVCALLAACGGGGRSSSSQATTTTVESAETRTWAAAAARSLLDDPSRPKGLTNADAMCMGRALVDTVTVARLRAAGATLADMRDPSKKLPPGLASSVPDDAQLALGGEMQACGAFGSLFGAEFAQSLADDLSNGYLLDAAERSCAAKWFRAPDRRGIVAKMILDIRPSADDTHDLASLLLDCIGIARLSAFDAHVTLSSKERSCIDALARRDPDAVKAIANLIGGSGDVVAPLEHLHARSAACLTPAHLAQLGGTG